MQASSSPTIQPDGSSAAAVGSLFIRDAFVITMDDEAGAIPHGDVSIKDGRITEVGQRLDVPNGAELIEGSGMICIPGLIDAHWHLWNTLLRGVVDGTGQAADREYFTVKHRLSGFYSPADSYAATRLSLLEAVSSGITTVNNWDHNALSAADVDAKLRAMRESGLRARYSYGFPDTHPRDQVMDFEDVERVAAVLEGESTTGGLIHLGVALRGPRMSDMKVAMQEWEFARGLDLPITMHCGGRRTNVKRYADLQGMHRDGMLGSDIQLVHALDVDDADIEMIAATGTHICLAPVYRSGVPKLKELFAAGIRPSLSTDTVARPSSANMFEQMRATARIESARTEGAGPSAHRMLEMATIDGARDLGLADLVGSIVVGKRADLVLLDRTAPNMTPSTDPIAQAVFCTEPANVDTVIVDGRVLKRGGVTTAVDSTEICSEGEDALLRLLDRADWHDFDAALA